MKILKYGNVYNCKVCKAKLKIDDNDWVKEKIDYMCIETYVKCPCCGEKIYKNESSNNE